MLFETIRCENGVVHNLYYHQSRLDKTLKQLHINVRYDLFSLIFPPSEGIFRCRFTYDANSFRIEYIPYVRKALRTFKIIESNEILYPFKYTDRTTIERLFQMRENCDDIIIIRNNLLCDTSIANIALFHNGSWMTPESPLLHGTTRERLINQNKITPARLTLEDLKSAEKIAIMNAMIGFVEVEDGIIT